LLLVADMGWRNLIPGLAGAKDKQVEKVTLAESLDEASGDQSTADHPDPLSQGD
jgi:hypothetical protein